MVAIPLPNATLCLDCGNVVASLTACPVCASESVLALSPVLDRQPKPLARYPVIDWPKISAISH